MKWKHNGFYLTRTTHLGVCGRASYTNLTKQHNFGQNRVNLKLKSLGCLNYFQQQMEGFFKGGGSQFIQTFSGNCCACKQFGTAFNHRLHNYLFVIKIL